MVLFNAGCGSKSSTPSKVVKSYFTALKEANYKEAQNYLSTSMVRSMEVKGVVPIVTVKEISDNMRKRKFEKIDILKEDIKAEVATVKFKITFNDSKTTETNEFQLVKEENEWKLDKNKPIK